MIQNVTQHGLMRSGTNLMRWLITNNYHVRMPINKPDWKHGPVLQARYNRHCVVTIRHPLSWLWSVYNFGCATAEMSDSFERWVMWNVDRHADRVLPQLSLYSFAYGYWQWRIPDAVFIRFEDVLSHPGTVCQKMAERFAMERKSDQFLIPNERISPNKSGEKGGREQIKRKELDDRRYLHHYTDDMIEHVKNCIDPSIIEEFNYKWD